MIHICICDDENLERNSLKIIINTHFELKGLAFSVTECENGEALIEFLKKDANYFDIIFLDIEMNGKNGIEIAKQIRILNNTCVIIFLTGFADYVFNGYEVKALNYVLKPYSKEKITNTLNEAIKQIDTIQNKFFIVQLNSNSYKVHLNEIIYFLSEKRKVKIVTEKNNYEFYAKLDDIEKEVAGFFIRTHQRYLVNLNFVLSIENKYIQINGENLPISRQRYEDVMIAFAKTMLN